MCLDEPRAAGALKAIYLSSPISETPSLCKEMWATRESVEGQGSGTRIDKTAGEEEYQYYDAMGNKIESVLLTLERLVVVLILDSYDLRILVSFSSLPLKERMARKKRDLEKCPQRWHS